ncbi:polysaccharide deacetylase family protein [Psychrobacillus sp. OK032]|uniref:polysaccharide deacetylase family protein n=1 Tax=Psychrobacillus sp. OK032 TaxID=1884358 RepID=UPI0008D16DD1|nr:polysaccharide deacetylase family protein [Psychrobacillus sp. OK032]SES01024.1 polysaccharide deacetylase family sporulation protein PdaB [Psychrobacillus sp. OK032]
MKSLVWKIGLFIIIIFCIAYASSAMDKGRPYYEEKGYVLWDIQTEEKVIALTFDDGPHSTYTTQILDLLAKYDAKATFFVIGERAENMPDMILKMGQEGHEIANHTYTHPYKITPEKLEDELKKTNEIIHDITGIYPLYYRPVGGSYDDRIINTAVENGYRVVMWSWHQDTEDWKSPGVDKIVSTVLSGAKPGNIVLFHDAGGDRSQTVKALEEILPKLEQQGYEFVTISELLEITSMSLKK